MAIHDGGELVKISNHVRKRHMLKGKIEKMVNSFHDYAIKECTENYASMAIAEDGVIEAIKQKGCHGKDGCGTLKENQVMIKTTLKG